MDIAATGGKKTALDKSRMLAASLERLVNGDGNVLNVFKCKTQAQSISVYLLSSTSGHKYYPELGTCL